MRLADLEAIVKVPCPSKVLGIDSDGKICFTDDATAEEKSQVKALMDINFPIFASQENINGL